MRVKLVEKLVLVKSIGLPQQPSDSIADNFGAGFSAGSEANLYGCLRFISFVHELKTDPNAAHGQGFITSSITCKKRPDVPLAL